MKKKTHYRQISHNPNLLRARLTELYTEKYFNLFLNSYKWEGISHDQREYIMRKFWFEGKCAAFAIIKPEKVFLGTNAIAFTDKNAEAGQGLIGFAPFSEMSFNMYDYPTTALLINERGVPYIPSKVMVNHEDIVLGYAQHDKQPIVATIKTYIELIVNAEMGINSNINSLKTPSVFTIGPDSELHAQDFLDNLENDTPDIFCNVGELSSISALNRQVPEVFKDFYEYKKNIEAEIKTFLGLDNNDAQKKERDLVDEVNANNDLINASRDCVLDNLKEFVSDIGDVLNFDLSVDAKQQPVQAVSEEQSGPQDGEPGKDESNGND